MALGALSVLTVSLFMVIPPDSARILRACHHGGNSIGKNGLRGAKASSYDAPSSGKRREGDESLV